MVIILRGISGAGKSEVTKAFLFGAAQFPSPAIKYAAELGLKTDASVKSTVSADYFFLTGEDYKFDASKLSEAHASCLLDYLNLVSAGHSVIVDNTNTTVAEIAPYIAFANAYKAEIHIITLIGDPERLWRQNEHGVPFGTAIRQDLQLRDSIQYWPSWFPQQQIFPV